ncbi:predicted protein [Botrytis cinerea T4]|uniref:Uncharacterized protein n=1 Tax=Botryotinia fuckeliana (strain T4) TaxID=999810 RepID=G2YL63_BOTF4|nr:predicted protein [Botrytis cinerea T4]
MYSGSHNCSIPTRFVLYSPSALIRLLAKTRNPQSPLALTESQIRIA